MKKTDPYRGPWPRKRHSHTCTKCKSDRNQGAVACYKSKCPLPQTIESCDCCRKLQPSATYQPIADDDGGRTRTGNTPTCEDCGKSDDNCTCGEGCPTCGCEPCSCDAPCAGCGKVECECNAVKVAADRVQYDPANPGKREGDIRRSYSADSIACAKSTIRAPFKHEGLLWCCVSLGSGAQAQAYKLSSPDHFKGKKTTYNAKNDESARADRNGSYHGMTVKHGRDTWVLTGPPVHFIGVGEKALAVEHPTAVVAEPIETPIAEPLLPLAVPGLVGVQLELFG